ncbi:hypothetical protein K493DRAFT_312369 [Basidiobolus meristosporus CBS 931.73]|uniref:Cytochrome c oxidase subunit 8, mitochondrial n=1 Tax=Basidiobolus meristosporus CBS 931.73 TaxID=1314790 RepID=A0A1Y1YUB8_9FUNG|nr:hypothetical protein K493DRAFT_312369 [Basidiobolus meristosporus CBS 931.73]|eukprot:ORY01633.1 hypothetical protein K493DRAFT_312369 [Basidiobolus meristosporus CBS 931.73]
MSVFARAAIRSRSLVRPNVTRSAYHFENENGAHLPFDVKKKKALAVKMVSFFGLGYALPFIASAWQLSKSQ